MIETTKTGTEHPTRAIFARSNVSSVLDIIKLAVTHIAVLRHDIYRHCRLMMHRRLAFNASKN